jgi:hypothetical protein
LFIYIINNISILYMGKKETRNRHYHKKRRYLVKNKTYRGGVGTALVANEPESNDFAANEVPANGVPDNGVPANEVPANEVALNPVSQNDNLNAPAEPVSQNDNLNAPADQVSQNDNLNAPAEPFVTPVPQNDNLNAPAEPFVTPVPQNDNLNAPADPVPQNDNLNAPADPVPQNDNINAPAEPFVTPMPQNDNINAPAEPFVTPVPQNDGLTLTQPVGDIDIAQQNVDENDAPIQQPIGEDNQNFDANAITEPNNATAEAAAALGISNPNEQATFTAGLENPNEILTNKATGALTNNNENDNIDITQPANSKNETQIDMAQLSPKFMEIIKDMYKWLTPEDKKSLIEELTKTANDAAVQANVQGFAETGLLFMQSLLAGPLAIGAAVAAGGSRRNKRNHKSNNKKTRSKK